jgi:hypothetical protein
MSGEGYLLAEGPSELERVRLRSQVWEPTGRQLLSGLGDGSAGRALHSAAERWAGFESSARGPARRVVATDIDRGLLDAGRLFLNAESRCFSGSSD